MTSRRNPIKLLLFMIEELFNKQRDALDYFFSHLNYEESEKLFDYLKHCEGVLFFTGVGKSGFIAQKAAATLMSTGTKAFFLPPIDALHGDLAMVSSRDLVIFLSKSGETEELLLLLPFVRNKGAKIVALTSNIRSRLSQAADWKIELPCQNELCPFDLAPTISTAIQLLFCDVMAAALMREKQFSIDEFAKNHPGGKIGKRASTRVSDLMLKKNSAPLCSPDALLKEVLLDFTEKRCGCLVVVDKERRLRGIFTDGDLRRALQERGENVLTERLDRLMTKDPKSISEAALAMDALKLMESDQKKPIMVLPVIDCEGKVEGVIKMHDLIQAGI